MPNLFPYTNTHELNLDWVLQVVKDFQTKYTTFDQALADALDAIETAKTGSLEDMQTALTAALESISGDLASAQAAITAEQNSALQALQFALTAALATLTTSEGEATARINSLYNTLPSSAQDILGKLNILDAIITGYTPESFVWLQGDYIYTEGTTPPTPPAINTESQFYTLRVSSRYMTGVAGQRIRIITDGTIEIAYVLNWKNTPPGGTAGAYVPGEAGLTETFFDLLIPLNVTAISIVLKKPGTDVAISPSDIAGHIEIQWITDFVSQRVIAPKEESLTANVARKAGELFFYDGILYTALNDIDVGDTIVLEGAGVNCIETTLNDELENLKSEMYYAGLVPIPMLYSGKYYKTNEETIDPDSRSSSGNMNCTCIACNEGDVFTINASSGGNSAVPWAFIDSSNNVLLKSSVTTTGNYESASVITAPANAAKLIINNRKTSTPDAKSFYGENIVDTSNTKFETVETELTDIGNNIESIDSRLNNIESHILIPIDVEIAELGLFSTDNLTTNTSSDSRGRTNIFKLPDGEMKLIANNQNYTYGLYEQTISGDTQSTSRLTASAWSNNILIFTSHADRNYRIMVRRTNQGSMVSDDLSAITFTFTSTTAENTDDSETLRYFNHGVPVFSDKEAALKNAVSNDLDENTIVFAVSADCHYNSFSRKDCLQPAYAKRMSKIAKTINVDFIANLGDIIEGFNDALSISNYHQQYVNSNRFLDMILAYTGDDVPFMYAAGHHERYPIDESAAVEATLTDGTPFVQNSAFKSCEMKPMAYGVATLARLDTTAPNSTGYRKFTGKVIDITDPNSDTSTLNDTGSSLTYYFDVTKNDETVRFIVVDGTFFSAKGYSPDTVSFVQTALQDAATNEYKVVIFNHIPLRWSEYDKRPGHNPRNASNEDAFISVLKNSGATILAYIHGHAHADNVVTAETENTASGTYPYADIPFPMISISCQRIYGSSGPYIGNYTQYGTRNVNSYQGYCFDVVALHTDTGILDFYRFGAGDSGTYPTRSVQGNIT